MSRDTRPIVFLDFDGTVTREDVVDLVLARHARIGWERVEDDWRAGRIGSRECLRRQIAMVGASPAALDDLVDAVEVDDGFGELLETIARLDYRVAVVSDGFDYCIARVLARPALRPLTASLAVYSSRLEPADAGAWTARFPFYARSCEHGCATCKPAVMRALNPRGAPSIFVGDGLSDRHAARVAGRVFAKASLARFCVERGLEFTHYASLSDVSAAVERGARGVAWRVPGAKERVVGKL